VRLGFVLDCSPPRLGIFLVGILKKAWQVATTMPEAFVLFKTEPSFERAVYLALSENSSVAEVHALYGEYDLLVRVTSDDEKGLTNLLMQQFRLISGVKETQTLIAVEY